MSDAAIEEKLTNDLKAMGIVEGDHLALGVSLKSLGLGGQAAIKLLTSLESVVSPRGTVVVPAFTRSCSHSNWRLKNAPIFDKESSTTYTGKFSEYLLAQPRSLRSNHPTNSIVALGAAAHRLTSGHDEKTPSYSPYSKLAKLGGKSLSIGIGDKLVGLRHEAQYQAGLLTNFSASIGCGVQRTGDHIEWFGRAESSGCVTRLPRLVQEMREHGLVTDGKLLEADCCLLDITQALDFMINRLEVEPEEYLCSNIRCLWCRETERHLGIGDRRALFDKNSNRFSRYIPMSLRNFYIDTWNRLELADTMLVARLRDWKSSIGNA